jgi:hypothetical protein
MMAATETPVAVRGDEHQRIGVRAGDSVADDIRRHLGEPAEAALLPGRDQRGDCVFICHRGPCGGERDPPPRAFTAPGDGPQRRCAAPCTVGAEQEWERNPAAVAEIRTKAGAGHATTREDQVENHIASKLERKDARVARKSVPKGLLLLERVFGAPRQPLQIAHPVVGVEQLRAVPDIEPVARKAVAVHRDAWIEPDDEPAWLIR